VSDVLVDSLTDIQPEKHEPFIAAWIAHNPRYPGVHAETDTGNADGSVAHEAAKFLAAVASARQREARSRRYGALSFLRKHSSNRRIAACSFARIDAGKGVGIRNYGGVAGFDNLQRCASVHACPVCAPKIRHARALEIQAGLAVHRALGGGVEFITLTLRHDARMRLAPLLELVANGFRTVIGAGRFVRDWYLERETFGIVGTIRTLEVNFGANGWHPHLHVLVLTAAPLDDHQRQLLTEGWWHRWSSFLADRGHHGTTREHGIIAVPVSNDDDVARYMSKVYDTLHHEMARGDLKRGAGRNPFKVLGDLAEAGRVDPTTGEVNPDWFTWREYEKAIKGRQFLTWSMGLKDRLGVNDMSDVEHAEDTSGGELIATLSYYAWRSIRREPRVQALVLTAAELHGEAGVHDLVDTYPTG
jgi:hypothetical protein